MAPNKRFKLSKTADEGDDYDFAAAQQVVQLQALLVAELVATNQNEQIPAVDHRTLPRKSRHVYDSARATKMLQDSFLGPTPRHNARTWTKEYELCNATKKVPMPMHDYFFFLFW